MYNKKPAVGESWLNLVDALTDGKQITGKLSVIEWTQLDMDSFMAPLDATR